MKKNIDFSLILPCFNEEGLLTESVRRIQKVLKTSRFTYEIIFVDDKSSDTTPDIIQATGMKALFHKTNQGRGKSVVDGIWAAKGEIVGYIDIDCEVSPVYIPYMVSLIHDKHADVVIGKRFYRTTPGSLVREVLSRGYQWVSDIMIGTGGLDTETGYKFFSRKKIVPILKEASHPGWFWDTEIMVYAKRAGLRIVEVPVLFLRRFDKKSSVNIVRDTIEYVIQLIRFRKSLR